MLWPTLLHLAFEAREIMCVLGHTSQAEFPYLVYMNPLNTGKNVGSIRDRVGILVDRL